MNKDTDTMSETDAEVEAAKVAVKAIKVTQSMYISPTQETVGRILASDLIDKIVRAALTAARKVGEGEPDFRKMWEDNVAATAAAANRALIAEEKLAELETRPPSPSVGEEELCECPLCGRMHKNLGFGKPPATIEAERLQEEHYQAAMAMWEKHRKLWVEASQENSKLRALLSTSEREGLRELAWVIENGPEPRYYAPTQPGEWTKDHLKACRFARKEDAEAVRFRYIDHDHLPVYGTRVCEHVWLPAAHTVEDK